MARIDRMAGRCVTGRAGRSAGGSTGGSAGRSTAGLLAALLGIGLAGAAPAPADASTESAGKTVRGRVDLSIPDVAIADLGPVVVYLEPIDDAIGDGSASAPAAPGLASRKPGGSIPAIVQRGARFEPSFLIVARGQRVSMPNADAIYHNVFSFSKPNDFDLGLYPAGESRFVRLDYAGVVKIYCSIHESMNATIFVAPSPHYAQVSPSGRFRLEGVPPGRYRISVWCERLPGMTAELVVSEDGARDVRLQWAPLSG